MKQNIHQVIIKRLLVTSTFIAIIVASIALYIELERIEKNVVHTAYDESLQYIDFYNQYRHDQDTNSLQVFDKAIKDRLKTSHHFIIIEFYTDKHDLLLRAGMVDVDEIRNELTTKNHKVLMDNNVNYKTSFVHNAFRNELYMEVEIPLTKNRNESIHGYLKGIYKVSSKEIDEIINDVAFVVMQSIATVIFTTSLLYPIIILLNKNLLKSTNDLSHANVTLLKVLGSAIAKRDSNTNAHNYRVTIYAIYLARAIKLDQCQIRALVKGAFLHDVGKIGISDNILLNPGKLDEQEVKQMQRHVLYGVEIIERSKWLNDAVDVVQYHHEKFDGSGYMDGLIGKTIPVNARVFAIVDVFDALTSDRPYKKALSYSESINFIKKGASSHFDPDLVYSFEQISKGLYLKISNLKTEDDLSRELDSLMEDYFVI